MNTKKTKNLEVWLDELAIRHPSHHVRLGLDSMREAMRRLQLVQPLARIVTIAGTNGKGSCLMLLEKLCVTAGLQVGSFQSPHIIDFCERIRLQGKNTDADSVARSFDRIDYYCSDMQLTFFEWNTLAALDIFRQHKLDIILLEVGLGGRLDAVNIIDNELAIITAIDYDHTDWLGDTIESIATEKAGIIRKQVISHSKLQPIQDTCQRLQAHALYWNHDFFLEQNQADCVFRGKDSIGKNIEYQVVLPTGCIADNLALAIQAWLALGYPSSAINSLSDCKLIGRQQLVQHGDYTIMLDVAHNHAAIKALSHRISSDFADIAAVGVIGMLADKVPALYLEELFPTVIRWIIISINGARGQDSEQLQSKINLPNAVLTDTIENISLVTLMGSEKLLIAMGSFHTSAQVIAMLQKQ